MRFCRFVQADGIPHYGIVEGQAVVEVEGDIYAGYGATSQIHPLAEVELLPPAVPSKIVALGANFRPHAEEMGHALPTEPKIFLKPPSALLGHGGIIRLPPVEGAIEHEAEIVVVMGSTARHLSPDQVMDHVLGFTCFNDVTARALQKKDGVYARAKGFDTFAPTGPWIETDLVWESLTVEAWVNGSLRQKGALSDLVFSVPEVLSFISRIMTLVPGDMIALGTPSGVGPLRAGDQVQVVAEGIGSLENTVAAMDENEEDVS